MSSRMFSANVVPIAGSGEDPVLRRAVAKFMVLGEQAGVSADQMILLLNSGLTVRELVNYVISRAGIEKEA